MRIQFDVTHPAHVHLFKNVIGALVDRGHTVAVTSRRKEMTTELLDAYGIAHTILSTKWGPKPLLALEWGLRESRGIRYARTFDPDVVVSRLNPPAIHGAWAADARSIVFHDSEPADRLVRLVRPWIDLLCTPTFYGADHGPKHRRYDGFHELAYLHPNWFTPDSDVVARHGIDTDRPYAVARFVSMGAHHDVGHEGFSPDAKRTLLDRLAERATVYVSSELSTDVSPTNKSQPINSSTTESPASMSPTTESLSSDSHTTESSTFVPSTSERPTVQPIPTPPAQIHHLLAAAALFVTDSDTMAAEAALLGTPTVRLDTFGDEVLGNFTALVDAGLVVSTSDESAAIDAAIDLLDRPGAVDLWRNRREEFLADLVDVTSYMIDVVEEVVDEQSSAGSGSSYSSDRLQGIER